MFDRKKYMKEYCKKRYLDKREEILFGCKMYRDLHKKLLKKYFKEYYQENRKSILKKLKIYRKNHKEQIKERNKEYYKNNKEKCLEFMEKYEETHKEQLLNYRRNYRELHKAKIAEYQKIYQQKNRESFNKYRINKYRGNINFKLICSLRNRLVKVLKGINKSDSTIKLIGCSIEQLKQYLEKQFKPGMSWQNYGKWEIDHICPCSSFDLSKPEEQRKCFHYTNLQPLWEKDNLNKGAKNV